MTSLAPSPFRRGRVQSQAFTRSSSQRGTVDCAWDSHLHQTVDRTLSSAAPSPLRRLDKTRSYLTYAGDADRPSQAQVRICGRKRAPPSATHYPRRQVKRPACTKTDRMLLVLLAKMARNWKQSHITRSARDVITVASSGIQAVLEIQVQSTFCQTKDLGRDRSLDQGDGK
jgi:hypothetical protein